MRNVATAVAIGFAVLTANAVLACDEKAHQAEQVQQKPAVAAKTSKQTKQQQKAKKAGQSEKTTVARSDKG